MNKYKVNISEKIHVIQFSKRIFFKKLRFFLLAYLSASVLSSCGYAVNNKLLGPYQVGIPQGNYLTKKNLESITIGMTQQEVQHRIGNPLTKNVFRPNQWNYFFAYQLAGVSLQQIKAVLTFSPNGILESIDASPLPGSEITNDFSATSQSER